MVLLKKLWRESASLIILGRNSNNVIINGSNYKVLVMKRSAKAKFMPNSIVFPGGVIEKSDSDKEWLSMYRSMGISDHQFKELATEQERRPFIFDRLSSIHGGAYKDDIDRDISLRISAVRETFEELGLLICKTKEQLQPIPPKGQIPFSSTVKNLDVKYWQKEVHSDATKFHQLCQKLQVIPDLWTMYEWSDWLTPSSFGPNRFDTSFYLVALPDQPNVVAEKNEVQEYMWMSPKELLELSERKELNLPPPQKYELARLEKLNDIETVINFAKDRNKLGTSQFYPIFYRAKDGLILLYPGDDIYPLQPDYEGSNYDVDMYADKTREELRNMHKNVHRLEGDSEGKISTFFCNIEVPYGHINPVSVYDGISPKKCKL